MPGGHIANCRHDLTSMTGRQQGLFWLAYPRSSSRYDFALAQWLNCVRHKEKGQFAHTST